MKKRISSVLAALLAGAMLITGCSSGNETDDNGNATGGKLTDAPQDLTVYCGVGNAKKLEEYDVQKYAKELTGVNAVQYNSSNISTTQEAFSLMMSTGDLPDVVYYEREDLNKYGAEGAFIPLNDLIDKYAPNLKKIIEEHPDLKAAITAEDGNIYCVTGYEEEGPSMGWFIRQDWLDKLGLEVPTSVDEFYNVLKAFKEQDPNGNGKQDEIPYFHRLNGLGEATSPLMAMFNARPGWYVEDGEVKYGPMEKNYATAFENIAKWYAEGLIDKEIFTRGAKARDVLLGDNIGGSTHDWFPSTSEFNKKLKDKVPGFKFSVIKPPAGKEIDTRGGVQGTYVAISAMSENPELAMKWIDFWYSDQGSQLMVYGVPEVDHTLVDGKPVYTDKVLNAEEGVLAYLYTTGAMCSLGAFKTDPSYEMQYMPQEGLDGLNLYKTEVEYSNDKLPKLTYTQEEEKEYTRIMTDISTYVNETVQKWVLGAEKVDGEKLIKGIKDMGIEKLIKIQNDAYKRLEK